MVNEANCRYCIHAYKRCTPRRTIFEFDMCDINNILDELVIKECIIFCPFYEGVL